MSCPNCGLENGEFFGHVCAGTYFNAPTLTFSPPCAKCAQLEADLSAARAEAARLKKLYKRLHEAASDVSRNIHELDEYPWMERELSAALEWKP